MEHSRSAFGGAILLLTAMSAAAQSQAPCTNASLLGPYGLSLDGSSFTGTSGPVFQRSVGLFTADGIGLAKASLTTTLNGVLSTVAYTGSYSIQSNCTGTLTLNGSGGSLAFTIGVGGGGQSAVMASVSIFPLAGRLRKAPAACSASTLSASYNWESEGEIVLPGVATTALSEFVNLQLDGRGGLTGGVTRDRSGSPVTLSINGQYTLNGDCTGSMHFSDAQGLTYNIAFVVVDGGASLLVIQTDAATVNSGTAVSSSFANVSGSLAQVASAGHWTTAITLVNNGPTPAQAVLNFYDDNGSPLSLPLSFPQTSSAVAATVATVNRTLNPGATLVIQSTGPDTQPTQTGWAQLLTSGNIGGHAVFAQTIGSSLQEAVVPIETRNPGSFVLPFDNLAGYDTGVALANIAAAAANIAVIIRDDSGATLQSQTITLPAQGHASFNLATRFAVTAQKRGTVEFDTPAGGQISVLGLRFNPTGAFSTVPPLGR